MRVNLDHIVVLDALEYTYSVLVAATGKSTPTFGLGWT